MEVMTGTKREITIRLLEEQLENTFKRLSDSMECFRRFHEYDEALVIFQQSEYYTILLHCAQFIMEDAEKLAEIARNVKDSIQRMDELGIK